jgi:ABC-type branched-subunit amino acid transport system permease subunit
MTIKRLGLVVGLIAIRRQSIYFAMVTLALAQMIYFVFLQAPFTGGEDGLQGVPRGKLSLRPGAQGDPPAPSRSSACKTSSLTASARGST